MPNQTLAELALLALLLAAAARDLALRRIPNRLLLAGLLCTGCLRLASHAPAAQLVDAALGFGAGLLLFLPLYAVRGMAAGDVKLMATVGAFTGPSMALQIALASCCLGGLMALLMVLAQGRLRAACANLAALLRPLCRRALGLAAASETLPGPSVGSMPYGLAIALGSCLMLWIGHS